MSIVILGEPISIILKVSLLPQGDNVKIGYQHNKVNIMVVMSKADAESKTVSRAEVDATLDKVFSEMTKALKEKRDNKITLDQVDNVLNELFDAINRAKFEGEKMELPDFNKIINGDS